MKESLLKCRAAAGVRYLGVNGSTNACVRQAQRLKCTVLALNGMPDHVHLVVRAPASLSPAQIVKQVKGVSSTFVRKQLRPDDTFSWRDGYFVRSLCNPVTAKAIAYVKQQKEHHAAGKLWPSFEIEEEESALEPEAPTDEDASSMSKAGSR
jgi:putative transposase